MPGIAPYIVTLAASGSVGDRRKINARGTTVFIRRSTETLLVTARTGAVGDSDGVAYSIRMAASEKWFTAEEFDTIELQNTGAAATEVEILLGYGDFFRPVPDIVSVSIGVPSGRNVVSFFDVIDIDVGGAGRIILVAANLNRTQLIINALASNTDPIRVGTVACQINVGIQLSPGESLIWENTDEVYACSETVNDQAVSLIEHTI